MEKITFVIPSRNNLDLLKLCYKSIKDLGNDHHILVLNDASVDGTKEWLDSLEDKNLLNKSESSLDCGANNSSCPPTAK